MATQPKQEMDEAGEQASLLAGKAQQCRRLAAGISDRQAAEVLRSMAENYERGAAEAGNPRG